MPNWCYNEFHIEVEGSIEEAIAIAQKLRADDSEDGEYRLSKGDSNLENTFPFEPIEIIRPPAGFLPASLSKEARLLLDTAHAQKSSGNISLDLKRAMHSILEDKTAPNPLPCDVIEAERAAVNRRLFASPTRFEWQDEAMGTARASGGRATIEPISDDHHRIVATIDSAWSPLDKAGSHILEISDKIHEVKTFWIEEGNDFYGSCLINRDGAKVSIDENGCGDALRQADKVVNNTEDEPATDNSVDEEDPDEDDEYPSDIGYSVLFEWLTTRMQDELGASFQSKSPNP